MTCSMRQMTFEETDLQRDMKTTKERQDDDEMTIQKETTRETDTCVYVYVFVCVCVVVCVCVFASNGE